MAVEVARLFSVKHSFCPVPSLELHVENAVYHKEERCHKQRSIFEDILVLPLHLEESRRITWYEVGIEGLLGMMLVDLPLMFLCDKWHMDQVLQCKNLLIGL